MTTMSFKDSNSFGQQKYDTEDMTLAKFEEAPYHGVKFSEMIPCFWTVLCCLFFKFCTKKSFV